MGKKGNNEKKDVVSGIDLESEEAYFELELDDGPVKCAIVAIFEVEGKDYIALLPLDDEGNNEDGEVWIYGYKEDENDETKEPELINITDEDEYERVSDAFDEYLDSQEFDELL